MHDAYYVYPPATIPVQIESIASFENNVILGTRQGHLLMYSVEQHPSENKMDLQLLQYNKNFSKKPISQIDVIPEYQMLFSLSDNIINVNDFNRHNFPLVHCADRTKGANIFALDVQRSKSLTGETALVVRVCVAIKRRLQFWYWKHDKLIEFGEPIDLAEVPKALVWLNNTICIGYKTDYVLYDISNKPIKRDLFPTSSSKTIDPCIGVINDCFAVAKDEFLIAVYPKSTGLSDPAVDKSLIDFHASNANDENKKFKSLTWSQPIQVLVWDEPYAVALVSNALEIRVLDSSASVKDTFIQTLPELKNARHLIRSKKGLLFAASVAQLWCIQAVDIPKQRQSLLQNKKFQLALQLTDISDESDDEKQAKKYQIQTLYAFDLFSNKFFKESMKEFSKLQTDPCDVIRLFPDLWPQDGLMSTPTKHTHPTAAAARSNLPKLVDKDLELGLLALIDYLTEVRYNLQKELHSNDSKSSHNTNRLLVIIDTTLLKCYLQTNDSLVASLLRLNYCNLEESEKVLRAYQKYGELIILYQTKGHHRQALMLLQSQALDPSSCLSGHDRTIQYLQHLGTEQKGLIFEFANWVIEKHPEDGLRIFTEDIHEVENLPRPEVLDYILKNHKTLSVPYLEHIINVWNECRPMFHNILIQEYRDSINELTREMQASPTGTENKQKELQRSNIHEKLIDFLQKSNHYTPDTVVKNFPTNDLFEERAIILGKLGKHEKVLAIHIQILGDVEKAAIYCENVYDESNEVTSNVFVLLIKTLLVPPTTPPYSKVPLHPLCLQPNVDAVLELLEKYATKLNPYAVLKILPDNIPLARLRTFLESALHHSLERRRRNQILKGLLYAENLQLQEQRMNLESQRVEVTEFSICPVCMKKFNNQSAFVRYPDGKIVHFACQERKKDEEEF